MMFRSGVGPSSAILRVDATGRYALFVGVPDLGPGAKTTMAMNAAEALGVPLERVEDVWGDSDLRDGRKILDVYFFQLRKTLKGLGLTGAIATVRGFGYSLAPSESANQN